MANRTYNVEVIETVRHQVVVEAESEEAAKAIAIEDVASDEDGEYFIGVTRSAEIKSTT